MRQSINIKSKFTSTFLHLLTFRRLCQFTYFLFMISHQFGKLHCSSANLDDPQHPREYLLAVTSGCIAIVGTKVLELSSLLINRSNRLTRLGYQIIY